MRILFIAPGDHVDYQSDCLLIGLKELLGADCVDEANHRYLYESFPAESAARMYGKGITICRYLPDLPVDRDDIDAKIRSRYFDLIVYGSVWRSQKYLDEALTYYPRNRLVFVDGEDEQQFSPLVGLDSPYFKRELMLAEGFRHSVLPINFAIPTAKVCAPGPKRRVVAICDPRDRSTYIYDTEEEYYAGYAESMFAVTIKKAGWDCLRHYEIMANGCIPLFLDLAQCPDLTMTSLPKDLLLQVLAHPQDAATFDRYIGDLFEATRRRLTTRALALAMLDKVASR